jgi:hypothetical protein
VLVQIVTAEDVPPDRAASISRESGFVLWPIAEESPCRFMSVIA